MALPDILTNSVIGHPSGTNWTAGRYGWAINLAAEDYAYFGTNNALDVLPFTISMWIKPSEVLKRTGTNRFIEFYKKRQDTSPSYGILFTYQMNFGTLLLAHDGETAVSTTNVTFASNVWTHIAATLDTNLNLAKIYTNGIVVATNTGNFRVTPTNNHVFIGSGYLDDNLNGPGKGFVGQIDDVRIYRRVLSPAEIAAINTARVSHILTPDAVQMAIEDKLGRTTVQVIVTTNGCLDVETWGVPQRIGETNFVVEAQFLGGSPPLGQPDLIVCPNEIKSVTNVYDLRYLEPGGYNFRFQSFGVVLQERQFTVVRLGDSDNDGMLDEWEVEHGLNPRVNDANEDWDGDGLTNLEEYRFGLEHPEKLDPRSAYSTSSTSGDFYVVHKIHVSRNRYDRTDRLIGTEDSRGLATAYEYDGNGNIIRQVYLARAQETNGLPVLWRYLNGLSATNNAGTNFTYADPDGDGWSNYQEWKSGSHPRDPADRPDTWGLPGLNLGTLSLPFTPSNFVVGVGQIDAFSGETIAIGADGDPGTNSNSILILTQSSTGWTSQRTNVGSFGITSIAVGQPTNRESAAVYLGLRQAGGAGQVVELRNNAGDWQTSALASSTDETASVLGVRSGNDVLASFATANAPNGALFRLMPTNNVWNAQLFDTNTSHHGLGTLAAWGVTNNGSLRLLDPGGIQVAAGGSTNSAGFVLAEPGTVRRSNWRGASLEFGVPRANQTSGGSVFYAFTDDRTTNGVTDAGDDFVLAEYLVSASNANVTNVVRQPIAGASLAQSYGLASINFTNGASEILFTAEPDGRVFSWFPTNATGPLQRKLFSARYAGKAWHALAGVNALEPGEGLVGLRVDPASPNQCDVIFWPPQSELWTPAEFPQTAPITGILPEPNAGGSVAHVDIRIWDTEGNASLPKLQFHSPGSTVWSNATVVGINGSVYGNVSALPTGVTHRLTWHAANDLGAGFTNEVRLRAQAKDVTLEGPWSKDVAYQVSVPSGIDVDMDGLLDDWEREKFDNLSHGPDDDPDQDGVTNKDEYIADTDPQDRNSYLRLNIRLETGQAIISWEGGTAARQFLEERLDLGDPNESWMTIWTNEPPTQPTGAFTNQLRLDGARFYRLRVLRE